MNLKRLVEISPAIASFLAFTGCLKLSLYYWYWGINVMSFLDFSEIILSFVNDLNILLFFTIILLLQMSIGIGALYFADSSSNKNTVVPIEDALIEGSSVEKVADKPGESFSKEFDEILKNKMGTLILIIFAMSLISFIFFFFFPNLVLLYLFLIIFLQLVMVLVYKLFDSHAKLAGQIICAVILSTFAICIGWHEIGKTLNHPKSVALQVSGKYVGSDSNTYFLGKTNNYYFFFDRSKDVAIIYPVNTVEKVFQKK
jgi:hypothetical protein